MPILGRALKLSIALSLFASSAAWCDPVFRWVDENGIVHYTNRPQGPGIKPAELPKITRGEVKLANPDLLTCKMHGDVNCEAGPDKDGSVICHDGFKDASPRFRFSCSSPKLEIADISDPDAAGTFSVFVRNSKPVAAIKLELFVKPPGDESEEIRLNGPDGIEAFGVGEFIFTGIGGEYLKHKPAKGQFRIACSNCP